MKWEWERYEPQLGVSYFLIPKDSTKNVTSLKHDRILVLSRKAYDLISSLKGKYGDFVFGYRSISHKLVKPLREKSEVDFRVHDLRHTFGHRLRNAGVTDDDRQNLLGHGQSITAYYSQVGLLKLVNELEKVKRPSVTDLPIQKKTHMLEWIFPEQPRKLEIQMELWSFPNTILKFQPVGRKLLLMLLHRNIFGKQVFQLD